MGEFESYINKETDITTWENEGGALKPQLLQSKKHNALMFCIGMLVALPLIYFVVKKRCR